MGPHRPRGTSRLQSCQACKESHRRRWLAAVTKTASGYNRLLALKNSTTYYLAQNFLLPM